MIPVVSIVGYSNSGKTTFVEKLVRELTSKGYKVGTIKHDLHGFDIDYPGKDSFRHREAGARRVILSSPKRTAVLIEREEEFPVEGLVERFMDGIDLIITEGYKRGPYPKIEIHRKETGKRLACLEDETLIAIFSDEKISAHVPCFEINDINKGVEMIEERLIKENTDKKSEIKQRLSLKVDGKEVPLKPFIEDFLKQSIKGMIASLKECENPEKVEIRID